MKRIGVPTRSPMEDVWQRMATAAAIASARKVIDTDGVIPPSTQIGRLSDTEWGWLVAAILFGWISARAEQAAAEKLDTERCIRMTRLDPEPWEAGAVLAILPELADACTNIDWSQPLISWQRETMVEFLLNALRLIRKAMIARDISDRGVTQRSSAGTVARQVNVGPHRRQISRLHPNAVERQGRRRHYRCARPRAHVEGGWHRYSCICRADREV